MFDLHTKFVEKSFEKHLEKQRTLSYVFFHADSESENRFKKRS